MVEILYIGGPLDTRQVAQPDMPKGDRLRVSEFVSSPERELKVHMYHLHMMGPKLFHAVHKE